MTMSKSSQLYSFFQNYFINHLEKTDNQELLVKFSRLNKSFYNSTKNSIQRLFKQSLDTSLVDSVQNRKIINIETIVNNEIVIVAPLLFKTICESGYADFFTVFGSKYLYLINEYVYEEGLQEIGKHNRLEMIKDLRPVITSSEMFLITRGAVMADHLTVLRYSFFNCLELPEESIKKLLFLSGYYQSLKCFKFLNNYITNFNFDDFENLIRCYVFNGLFFNEFIVDYIIKKVQLLEFCQKTEVLNRLLSKVCRHEDAENVEEIIENGATYCLACRIFAEEHNNVY